MRTNSTKHLLPASGAVLALAGLVAFGAALTSRPAIAIPSAKAQNLVIGQQAPTFTLPNVETGTATSLTSLSGGKKATVIMFISTKCPVSNAYNQRMIDLTNKYSAEGVEFVAIDSNQTEPMAICASYTRDQKFPFTVLKDGSDAVANAYYARVTPETFVIDPSGTLVYHGRIDNSQDPDQVKTHELSDALDSVIAGRSVAKPQTKAFGCSIKRGA